MLDTPSLLPPEDRDGLARRLRELLHGHGDADPGTLARTLGVSEVALRMSIDEESPRPSTDVIVAAVRYFGVDPNWLLTGEYDAAVHRQAIEGDRDATAAVVNDLTHRRATPTGTPALKVFPPDTDLHTRG